MIIPPFTMSFCNIYEQQTIYKRYHSLNVCGTRFASSWLPLNLHPLPLKTERGRADKVYMKGLCIVCSTDLEKCKRMHLVIIVCIPCDYVRRTWYICLIRSASALSAMLYPVTPSELPPLSPFIRQASDLTATYYLCPFFSILFSQIFDNFVDFWSGWKRMTPTSKLWSSAVSFFHTLCVHRSVGTRPLEQN